MSPQTKAAQMSPGEMRHEQILEAAMTCFARRGFHQTTMQDISTEAGISVGLIYRYFESKEQVIASMAKDYLSELQAKVDEARRLPNIREALETVVWCDDADEIVAAAFVLDLFSESGRNPHVRRLMSQVRGAQIRGLTSLIASSAVASQLAPSLTPTLAAEMIFHAVHGLMFDEILQAEDWSKARVKKHRTETLRRLWGLLFPASGASSGRGAAATRHAP